MANPTFTAIGTNSFGLSNSGSEGAPALADLDGDGDLDLLAGNAAGDTVFYRNTGTSLAPTFSLVGSNVFGITNVSQGGALPALADIDGDGDLDLFIGNHAGTTLFYRNSGTSLAPTFSLEGTNLFGLQSSGGYGAPGFADLDGDQDLDLVIGNAAGNLLYYRNSGTSLAPTFSLVGTNVFGMLASGGYSAPELKDIDGDGDVDLIDKTVVYINTGTTASPTFSLVGTNAFMAGDPGAYPRPALGDLDGDGDIDLLFGTDGGDKTYFRNVSPVAVTLGDGGTTITLSQVNTLTGGAGTDVVTLGPIGATFIVTAVETLIGGSGTDVATLGSGGNTLTVSKLETLTGGSGTDVVTLGSGGNTLLVGGVETLTGGLGTDVVTLASGGNTLRVTGVETLTGGLGADAVTLATDGNTLTVSKVETLTGGAGTDAVTLNSGGNTLLVSGIETLIGGANTDVVTLGSGGNTLLVRLLETLAGGSGTDAVTLGSGGNTLLVRLLETLAGGSGTDAVTLDSVGNTLAVSGIETLTGGSGTDVVTLASDGNTLTVSKVETLTGGAGTDVVTLGTGGNTTLVSGIETLTGGSGTDAVTLASDGNTLTVSKVETLTGGSGTDAVTLGSGGNTLRVFGIETVTGSAGTDVVTLSTGGNTLLVSALETLLGGSGTDVVTLGNSGGNTLLVSALETLTGGSGTDLVNITASGLSALVTGIETLNGNSGQDFVTLGNSGGNTLTVSRLDTLVGSAGTDVVTLSGTFASTLRVSFIETLVGSTATDIVTLVESGGNTLQVSGIETLTGGSGTDAVTLGSGGNTLLVWRVETLTGGAGTDVVTLSTGSNEMTVSGVETLTGGSGLDIVTLGSGGNTLTVWRVETLTGGSGTDRVTLGSAGNTLQVGGLETLTGGSGTDVVTLDSGGNTLTVGGVETLTGGLGTDAVTLGGGGNTLTVGGLETLTGGSGTDVVTLGSGGNTLTVPQLETLVGGTGTDVVTFSPPGNVGTLFVSGVETVCTPFQTLTLNGTDTLIVLPASPSAPALAPASDSGVSGDALTNASQPTLTGTADAGSVVHLYGNGGDLGTGTADGSGAWSVVPGTALADGAWTLTAKVITSGVESGPSGSFLLTIDTSASAPAALALAAASNSGSMADTLTNVAAPVITGSVAEAGTVVLYEGATALGTVTAAAAGAWSVTTASLSDGAHTLSATVTDAAGNTSTASTALTVTIDTTAATPSQLGLASSSNSGSTADTLTNVAAPVITGSVSEAGTVVLYEGATALGTVTASTAGAWTVTSASLSDGAHTLSATVTDAAGNTSTASTALTVTIDTTAATPSQLGLASSSNSGSMADTLTNVATPVITGSVGEAGTVVLYEGATALGTVTAATAGAWTVTAASLSDGAHTLSATVTDAAGNTSTAATALTVTIDTTAATPSQLGLASSSNSGSMADTLTNVAASVITGSVAEAGTVVLYEGSTALGTVTASTAGAWSVTTASLSDGAHTLSATVTDAAGNTSTASTALTVTIDTTAATPSQLGLASSSNSGSMADTLTNVATPVITGSVGEAGTVVLYEGATALGTVTASTAGAWTVTSASLSDGAHTLSATVTDAAGNTSTAATALTVTIDTSAPAPAGLALAAASNSGSMADTLTNVATPVITGSVGEAGTVVLYEGSTALGTVTASTAGAWTVTAASLSDGAHTLSATVTDAAGNTSTAATALTVTIDTTAATPSQLGLAAASNSGSTADTLTNVAAPVITGSVSEAGTVVLYEGATALGTVTASTAGAWTVTSASLSDGAHTLSATVTDAAGNTSTASTALTVTIDTSAPAPAGLALAAASNSGSMADTLTNVAAPVITGSVGEAGTVVLYEGATALGTVTAAAAAGTWTVTAASLSDGAHTLSATVTDAAGNTSTASTALTVTIDTTAATPSQLGLASSSNSGSTADTLTNVAAPVITGSVAEAGTVVLYEGATALGTVTASTAGAWTVTAASLSDGAHTLSATVTDAAGNTSTASTALTVTIDTGAPSVAIALSKTTFGVGETATVTFTFSEAPVGFSTAAVTTPNGALSNLAVLPGSDGLVYTATLTPTAETLASESRITVATGWSDAAGNAPAGVATSVGYAIDTRSPPSNAPPVIGGSKAGQPVDDNASRRPFATMTVSDADAGQTQTVTVTVRDTAGTVGDATGAFTQASLDASGFTKSAAGTYGLTAGSAAAVQAALRLLDFQPAADRKAPGGLETTAFTATVTDEAGASAVDEVTSISALSVNDAPLPAQALGTRSVDQGQAFSYTVPAGAFTDADTGDTLTFSATGGDGAALPGWLGFDAATGRLSGTPGNADVGTRTVRVTATDASGAAVSDLLTIQVADVNDAPLATNDAGGTDARTALTVAAAQGVLANDSDPDTGDRLTVGAVAGDAANVGRAITLSGGGTLTLNADGGYSFDPAGAYATLLFGQTRQETVTYTVADRAGATATATLTITVRGANTAPAVQQAKQVAIDQNSSRVGLSIDKPVDPEGDPLTITVTGLPTVGTLQRYDGTALAVGDTLTPEQLAAVVYTPPFGATGAAGAFRYAVSDGTNLTGGAVTIGLTPVQWLSITPSSLSVAEGNGGTTTLSYTITRRGDTSGATTVKWQVDTSGLGGGLGGSLADAADFGGTLPSGTVTFAAGETSRTVGVPVSGDRLVEGNEQFRILLFSPSTTVAGAKITVESASALGTILNDDRAATVTKVTGPAAGRYLAARGDTLDFTVAFSDSVSVSGGVSGAASPRLALTIGTQTRYASLLRVDGGELVFRYAVAAGDLDSDGIAVAGGIDLNGAQIVDSAGNLVTGLTFGSAAPATAQVLVNVRGGHAIDGYIAGATVFADANANGQLDAGEASGTTNAVGSWSIQGGSGPIVMVGGTDISTNLAFTGVYEAPGAASVITPLTTIVMGMAGLAGTDAEIAAAATELKSKLGLDAGLDLLSYDPIVAVTTAGADAAAVAAALKTQAAATSVANVIVQGSAVLAGVVIGAPRASGVIGRALVGAIADAVKAVPAGSTIDFADPAVLAAILAAAGARIGVVDSARLAAVTSGAANVIAASNGAVITAGTTNSGGLDGLTQMAQAQVVAQGSAAEELRSGTAAGDLSGAVAAFTGSNLQQQISTAQVAVVVPSRLSIAATDADKREGDTGSKAFTFTVTRAGNTGGALTVDWAVAGGNGTGGSTLDAADFGGRLPSDTITFADGEATKTITIQVSGDTDIEPDETFAVTLSNPSVAATAFETATASGTIRNDDPINPTLTLPAAQTVVAGTAAAIGGLAVADGDSASVTATLTPGNGSLVLAGPATVTTAPDGTVTVSGSVADVNATLASLVFTGAKGMTAGSVAVTLADDDPTTPDASGTLSIAIQSPPANTLPSSPTLVAGVSSEVLGLEITDADGGSMTVVLTPTNGTIRLPLYGGATADGDGTGPIRLTGTLDDVNRTLQQLEFTASRDVTSASIQVDTSDDQPLTADAGSLLVIGVLSSPEQTVPATLSAVSGVPAAVRGLSVGDFDSPTLQVTLAPTGGTLALTAQGGVVPTQPSAGVWRLLGTQADIAATLATLTFTGTAGASSGTIRVTTSDLGTLTTDADATIAVTIADPATLAAPTLTLPQPVTLDQGQSTALAGIQVADSDSGTLTVTLTPTQATLGAAAAGQATVATAIDGTVTIAGTVADVNATLATLRITGGLFPTATVAVSVSDGATAPATGTLTLPLVDRTPPGSPTITAISADAGGALPVTTTNRNRLYVRGTAEANSRVALSDTGSAVATVTADATGAWVADLGVTPLADGTHAFTARATDAAGNTGPASGARSVTVDTVAPPMPSVAFTAGTIDRAGQASVGFVLTGAEVGTAYRWALSSSGGGAPLAGTGTATTASATVGGLDVSALADGTLSLSVTLTDAAGNASAAAAATVTKAAGTLVDGAQVLTSAGQANGQSISTVTVRAPAQGRAEDPATANAALADVPLVRETLPDPASGAPTLTTTLQVGLPTGVGVTASGPTNRGAPSQTLADLIRAIEARTAAGSASRADLTGGGSAYLNALPPQASLLLRTLSFTASATPGAAVQVGGAAQATAGTPTALVIDTTGSAGPLTIQLDRVAFAAVIGSATLTGGAGDNVVYGDANSQSIILGPGDDLLSGGGGNDTVASTLGNDTLYGDGGDDLMNGGEGDDLMDGGADNDTMGGGAGRDTMGGGAGNDVLIGEGGDDALFGGTGNDILFGGDGNDLLFGQEGDDVLALGDGADIADGGDGDDTLFGQEGDDTLFGGAGADILALGAGNDLGSGGAGTDTLYGEDGNDTLFGAAGDDVLSGGAGDDLLFLDQGADTAWGGAGADCFALGGASGGAMVMDFTAGTDRLALFDPTLDLSSVIASARVVNGSTVLDLRPGVSVTIVRQAEIGQTGAGQAGDVARWFT